MLPYLTRAQRLKEDPHPTSHSFTSPGWNAMKEEKRKEAWSASISADLICTPAGRSGKQGFVGFTNPCCFLYFLNCNQISIKKFKDEKTNVFRRQRKLLGWISRASCSQVHWDWWAPPAWGQSMSGQIVEKLPVSVECQASFRPSTSLTKKDWSGLGGHVACSSNCVRTYQGER